MKKTKLTTANTGGVPFQALDFQFIQDEAFKGIMAHLNGLYVDYPNGFVIQGCLSSIVGATYNISEGYVYLNGDIIFFPAVTGILLATSPVYYEGTASAENRNYLTGGSFTFAESKTVTTSVTSGDTITFTSTGTQSKYQDALTSQTQLKSGTFAPTVASYNGSWTPTSPANGQFIRVGNRVFFSVVIALAYVNNTSGVDINVSLPIARSGNFANGIEAIGTFTFSQTSPKLSAAGTVNAEVGQVLLRCITQTVGSGNATVVITGSYTL